ncbi:Serine dehydrogenase proteinase [Limimonas halophila]|uniref:Serine dehydrogenase proteinase n=1 Tax=Limimonas halophila TaxID=1082479 RepID=A0A1G7STH5_9PROT|nr:serine protease [Limimonas halophila]SDG26084.1 Serine dehydrogenase proteinase [Limimonas halophila]
MPNWKEVLDEIRDYKIRHQNEADGAINTVRREYVQELSDYTGRNIIAYYSGFLSMPRISGTEIRDEDKNGFMMAVHNLDRERGLDLILHTPGGDIAATESIVHYLRAMFGLNMRVIVPQIAMSSGTMIACACDRIYMGKHSNLGPIDPQINGIPAQGVLEEFRQAYNEITADPQKAYIWQPILDKYAPTFLSQCENAVNWAKSFAYDELRKGMFRNTKNKDDKINKIIEELTDYRGNMAHNKHLPPESCEKIGLKIKRIENDSRLQDLVLTVHHCYMHSISNTAAMKMIENHNGIGVMRQQVESSDN